MIKIKAINCLEVRMFYDSKWRIELEDGSVCTIVRDDDETEAELRKVVESCKDVEEIKSKIDRKNKIYYD